jgi:DNA processing protein
MPLLPDRLAWMTLSRAPQLGIGRLGVVLERLGQKGVPLDAAAPTLVQAGDALWAECELPAATRDYLASSRSAPTAGERRWLEAPHHHVVAFTDAGFPPLLLRQKDCPPVLYVDGRRELLTAAQLAVVGSRNPTSGGRTTAYRLAHDLAVRGLAITSGLAEGIDGAAHRGALDASAATLAVLGTGVDRTYPAVNRGLSRAIARHGALISQFSLESRVCRSHFVRRNRLMAGLSLGTLVVEAARSSGSMITAGCTEELGRQVFAVPGSIENPLAHGCHELIRRGAILTESADDILIRLRIPAFAGPPRAGLCGEASGCTGAPTATAMDKDHKILLDALGFDPTDLDALVVRTGFKPEAVSSMMLILELEGHVQAAHGGRYSRVGRSC